MDKSELKDKIKDGAGKVGEAAKKGGLWIAEKFKQGAAWTGAEMRAASIRADKKNAQNKKKEILEKLGQMMYENLIDKHHGDVVDVDADEDVMSMIYEVREWNKVIAECDEKLSHIHE